MLFAVNPVEMKDDVPTMKNAVALACSLSSDKRSRRTGVAGVCFVGLLKEAGKAGLPAKALAEEVKKTVASVRLWMTRHGKDFGIELVGGRYVLAGFELPPVPVVVEGVAAGNLKGAAKVFWSDEEVSLVVEGFIENWRSHPERPLNAVNFGKAMHRVLPADRWRKLLVIPVGIRNAIAARMVEILTPKAPEQVVVEVEREVPLDVILGKATWRELFSEIGSRFDQGGKKVDSALDLLLGISGIVKTRFLPAGAPEKIHEPFGCVSAPPEKIRVWVIGPLRAQYEDMVERLKNFPFKFLGCQDKDKSPNAVSIPSSADLILADIRFISHSWRDTIKSRVPKEKLIECDGIRAIENWLREKAGKICA